MSSLNTIIQVFGAENGYGHLYRFVKQSDFLDLFDKHQLFFTNPKIWTSNDKRETYFESCWGKDDNIRQLLNKLIDSLKIFTPHGIKPQSLISPIYASTLGIFAIMQKDVYCYCLSKDWRNYQMINEYYKHYNRKIVLCFRPDFYKRLAICPDVKSTLGGNYLFADIFPVHYIAEFQDFIADVIRTIKTPQARDQLITKVLDIGVFLKDRRFDYENEVRLKLSFQLENLNELIAPPIVLSEMTKDEINSREKIINYSLDKFLQVRKLYATVAKSVKEINENGFLYTFRNCSPYDLIDQIIVSQDLSSEDYITVRQRCSDEHIMVQQCDFEQATL